MAEKTIAFPSSHEGFLSLARLKSEAEEYDSAMQFAYKAYKAGQNKEEAAEFMARQLFLSENAHEALRLLYRFFPDADKRPVSVLYLMRDCYLAIHEYMNAHNTELLILDMGEPVEESDMPDSVEEMLAMYELSLNDAYAFGCDDSSLTDEWCDIRPIMNICAVHNAFYYMAEGDFERVRQNLYQPLSRCFCTDEISLPEEYLLENCGMFMNACLLGGKADQYVWCVNGMDEIPSQMPRSLSAVTAFALITKLSHNSSFNFDFPDTPDLSREELLSIAMSFICADEKALAYKYIKNVLNYAPYNIGINRIYAYCAYACNDIQGCFEAYDRINKLLMWDRAAEYTRNKMLGELKNNAPERAATVPLCAEDKSEAAEAAMDTLADLLNQSISDIEKTLDEDSSDILCTYFSAMKSDVQEDVAKYLCESDADNVQELLRRLLLDRYTENEVKNIIIRSIRKKKDTGKIACCCNANFFEAYPYMRADLPIPDEYNEEYKNCYNIAVRTHGEVCALAFNYYYEYFSEFCLNTDEAEPRLSKAFAVIVLSMAMQKCGILSDTETLAKTHYIDMDYDEIEEMLEIMDESERGFIYDLYGDM